MSTATLPLTISKRSRGTFRVEVDRNRFERVADSLGLFSQDFIGSIDRAESDIRNDRVRAVKSLRPLR